jgi:hypothetical protein
VIDTLTDTDYVSVVDFSSSAVAYGDGLDELVPATADNLEAIQAWINGLRASGTTNFNDAFAKAWAIFRMSDTTGASSGCNKVRATASSRRPSSRPPPPPPPPPHRRRSGPMRAPFPPVLPSLAGASLPHRRQAQ